MSTKTKTNPKNIKGDLIETRSADFTDEIALNDHKIKFAQDFCGDKDVLDIGCVHHNPENYKSKYWLHKAIKQVSRSVVGIDLYRKGVEFLNEKGFDIHFADAQEFELGRTFDVIVAGDLIEHLEDFHGFLTSCKKHLRPDGRLLISTPNPWYWRNFLKAACSKEVNNNPEHTCWLCPRTLRQLVNRHDMDVGQITFGSRYPRDRLMPLPRGWKHPSFHAEVFIKPSSS